MPRRPITKKDLKELKENYLSPRFKFITDEVLGIVVFDSAGPDYDDGIPWAYQCYKRKFESTLTLHWITERAFRLRKKLGHPKPRKKHIKQILREPDFGLDEIALGEEIISQMD